MKKNILSIIAFWITIIAQAQQISDGFSPVITDFSTPLKSGVYSGLISRGTIPDATHDWSHLFVIRHSNQTNNYQLQIASSYSENDRLFFRKIAYNWDLSPRNTAWIELATRDSNNFKGNQIFEGNLGIRTSDLTSAFSVGIDHGVVLSIGNSNWAKKDIIQTGYNDQVGDFTDIKVPGYLYNDAFVRVLRSGNVGIGTSTPDAKLAVNGNIHSKEVKVDTNIWPDYVFNEEYNLPTLAEVENHIKEKGHLHNIPSEEEVLKNGIHLGEMNAKLLQKIEELTLYVIELNKKNEQQFLEIENSKKQIEVLKKENGNFKMILEKLKIN